MDMKNWPRVNFDPELYQICKKNLVTTITKKLSDDLESLHFLTFPTKRHECKIGKRDGHGKSRNGHGKVSEKYFVKEPCYLIRP